MLPVSSIFANSCKNKGCNASGYSQLHILTVGNLLTSFLASLLTSYPTVFLAHLLIFFLTFFLVYLILLLEFLSGKSCASQGTLTADDGGWGTRKRGDGLTQNLTTLTWQVQTRHLQRIQCFLSTQIWDSLKPIHLVPWATLRGRV